MTMTEPVVSIEKLWTVFKNGDKESVIHKDLDLTIERGEVMSLVGGSVGSGVAENSTCDWEEPGMPVRDENDGSCGET